MTVVAQESVAGYVRYLYMPGFYEAWTYSDGRRPVYACQCVPVRPRDIPVDVLTALWIEMNRHSGFVPYETDRVA